MPTLGPETVIYVQPPANPVVAVIPPGRPGVIVVPQPGPPGPPGSGTGVVYTQGTPASTWTINTALGRKPYSVMIMDTNGNEIGSDVSFPSNSQIVVTFATPQAGSVAYT